METEHLQPHFETESLKDKSDLQDQKYKNCEEIVESFKRNIEARLSNI